MVSDETLNNRSEVTVENLLNLESRNPGSETSIQELYRAYITGVPAERSTHVVATGEDPLDWTIPDHKGRLGRDWSSKRLKDFPRPFLLHAVNCAIEYGQCHKLGRPLAHVIEQSMGGVDRTYARLIVPRPRGVEYAYRPLIQPVVNGVAQNV